MPLRTILLRCFITLGIAVSTLEICARIDDFVREGAPIASTYSIASIFEFDNIGQKGRPGARFGKWNMNSLGYRGPEPDAGRQVILAVGSSETFGQYESEGKEWPRQLQSLLDQAHPGQYSVINTALSGETFPTSVRRLPEHLSRLRPKAVLFYPSLAHYLHLPYLTPPGAPPAPPRFAWRLSGRLDAMLKSSIPVSWQTYVKAWQTDRAARGYQPILHNMPKDLQQRFKQDLIRAAGLVREAGATPIFVTHTHRFGQAVSAEEHHMLISWRRFYPMLAEDGFLPMEQSMNDAIRRTAGELRIPLLDVAPSMPNGPRYYADFVHFTDEGSAIFSRQLYDGLLKCLSPAGFACPPTPPVE